MESLDLILCIIFLVAGVVHIATIHKLQYPGDFIIKAIPADCLAIMALLFIPGTTGYLLAAGFFLSAGGDISLSFKSEKAFLIGLGLFLLAHVAYLITFSLDQPYTWERWPMMLALAVFAIGMAALLFPKLGEMRIPVLVYVSVILAMGVFACLRTGERPWLLISGATLFMLSDSVIALDKFLKPIPGAKYIIMLTYYAGQFLICRSFVPGDVLPF